MKRIGLLLLLLSGCLLVGIGLFFKYANYKRYIESVNALLPEQGLGAFYSENLRFPKNETDFQEFIDKWENPSYRENLQNISFCVKYDSTTNSTTLYSGGFDSDDDKLVTTYNPLEIGFIESLIKDGDVVIQHTDKDGILYALDGAQISLRNNKPDSTLKSVNRQLYRFSMCYMHTIPDVELVHHNTLPQDETIWVETNKTSGQITVSISGSLDQLTIERVQREFQNEFATRGFLNDMDNVKFGFNIRFDKGMLPIWCDEGVQP